MKSRLAGHEDKAAEGVSKARPLSAGRCSLRAVRRSELETLWERNGHISEGFQLSLSAELWLEML